jgi:hypothetical protein
MFKSISWQEYIYAIGLIAAGYYVLVVAVFYSRDILSKLRGATVPKGKSPRPSQASHKEKFMGAISDAPKKKIPIKQSEAAADEFFIESDPEELMAAQRIDSPAAELYDRLESLFKIMKVEKVKTPNLKSIKTLFTQYPQFKETPIQLEVAGFIHDHFRMNTEAEFTLEEINILWLDDKQEIIHQSITKNNYEK